MGRADMLNESGRFPRPTRYHKIDIDSLKTTQDYLYLSRAALAMRILCIGYMPGIRLPNFFLSAHSVSPMKRRHAEQPR
jgi:hypothetical protein